MQAVTRREAVRLAGIACGVAMTANASHAWAAGFAGGTGTSSDPYQIATADQLAAVADDLTSSYVLVADIDLAGVAWTPLGCLTYSGDVDMQTGDMDLAKAFSGTFDGDGHVVSGLTCTTDDDMLAVGLIGCSTGTVINLVVENALVDGGTTTKAAGGVVGYALSGAIEGVTLRTSTVTGTNCVGGIVGGNMAAVSSCAAEDVNIVVVGDNDFAGGEIVQADVAECGGLVVGGGFTGSVDNCTASGTVTATGNEPVGLGGIGGCLQCMDHIANNTVTVTIEARNGHAIGGLCGYAGMGDDGDGTVDEPCAITNCTVNVDIVADGATHVGGLVGTGLYYYGMEDRFTVEGCSVTGTITGAVTPGSVAGRAQGSTVVSCETSVAADGEALEEQVGTTSKRYMSADQYEDGSEAAAIRLFDAVAGTYTPLFDTIITDDTYQLWFDDCLAILDDEDAAEYAVDLLQGSITGEATGEEAVAKYAAEDPTFFCGFTQDVARFTFDGTTASGVDADGVELFSHEYAFESYDAESGFYAYKTGDADAGEFTYIALLPDTPASTFHIEFRYGSDLDDLNNWTEGQYAYWMAAGIPVDADDAMVANGINLFCTENLVGASESEETAAA